MASWYELVNYVKTNYELTDERPNMVSMIFKLGGGRSQIVYLWKHLLAGEEEWVQIESPFAEMGSVSPQKVIREVSIQAP